MRFLAYENVPAPVVAALRAHRHDLFSIKESMRGADDLSVLAHAQTQRIIDTLDNNGAELSARACQCRDSAGRYGGKWYVCSV